MIMCGHIGLLTALMGDMLVQFTPEEVSVVISSIEAHAGRGRDFHGLALPSFQK